VSVLWHTARMLFDFSAICYLLGKVEGGGLTPLGTAFALGGRKIATALHVVRDAPNVQLLMPAPLVGGYQDTTDNAANVRPLELIEVDTIHDLAVLEAPQDFSTTVPYRLGSTDEMNPGMPVSTHGYPHVDAGRYVLTQYPTTVGAKVLVATQGVKIKHLVLNTLLQRGQSGSLVLNPATKNVVAIIIGPHHPTGGTGARIVVSGVDPAALNQTAHAVSAEYLTAMIR